MIPPPEPPHPLVVHWLQRHLSVVSFVLHLIGIPLTILGVLLFPVYAYLVSFPIFVLGLGLFLGGFGLQFAGHYLEKTDPGEVIYFKRLFGMPYVEFPLGGGPFAGYDRATEASAGDDAAQSQAPAGTA
ncbi:Mpo1-like protein [Planctomyces sp. SH-PL62]|uniref:Mpo1-like protein n=1 Tax=Planctomyces sp. SH-PL62 TaxID=1636152 RepID=UPI00078C6604|nr:Mpo1-like protein [Planctomyces sp. SH-PL62]AMV39837.1 hypothetical protein VT85_20565 [Planctomyces sp. SH-PL62]